MQVSDFRIDTFIDKPIQIADGAAQLSNLPGLGVVFDFKALEKFRDPVNKKTAVVHKKTQTRITAEEATRMTKKVPGEPWEVKSSKFRIQDDDF